MDHSFTDYSKQVTIKAGMNSPHSASRVKYIGSNLATKLSQCAFEMGPEALAFLITNIGDSENLATVPEFQRHRMHFYTN